VLGNGAECVVVVRSAEPVNASETLGRLVY
jgi:hypothetical protein